MTAWARLALPRLGPGFASGCERSGLCVRGREEARTSLVVELLEHLADDLPDTLQRLEVVFCLVVLLLQCLDLVAHCGAGAGVSSSARSRADGFDHSSNALPRAISSRHLNPTPAEATGSTHWSELWHQSLCAGGGWSCTLRAPCYDGPPPARARPSPSRPQTSRARSRGRTRPVSPHFSGPAAKGRNETARSSFQFGRALNHPNPAQGLQPKMPESRGTPSFMDPLVRTSPQRRRRAMSASPVRSRKAHGPARWSKDWPETLRQVSPPSPPHTCTKTLPRAKVSAGGEEPRFTRGTESRHRAHGANHPGAERFSPHFALEAALARDGAQLSRRLCRLGNFNLPARLSSGSAAAFAY